MGSAAGELLVEREHELRLLDGLLARASQSIGGLLLLEGPAGIGKSRLCLEARDRAGARGLTTLWARGGELEHDLVFGVARQLLERTLHDSTAAERRRLLSGPARLAAAALGGAAEPGFSPETGADHGLYWLVSNLAEREPLAVVVDDAHWADQASLGFLLYLTRRLEGLPVAVVLAARPQERSGPRRVLDLLAVEPVAETIAIAPLTERAATELVEARLQRALPPALARACHQVTGGTPFFLGEVAHALAETPMLDRDAVGYVQSLVPPTVSRSVLLRLGRQPESVRAVAEALAAVGEDASIELLRLITGTDRDPLLAALRALRSEGIVSDSGAVALAHPIIRTAIYQDLGLSRAQHLHAAAAGALQRLGRGPDVIAHHLILSEPAGDAVAVDKLREAAERALARGSAGTAVRLLNRALHEPPEGDRRAQVLSELGRAELAAQAPSRAVEHLREALAQAGPDQAELSTALALSQALALNDGYTAAITELRELGEGFSGEAALRLDVERTALSLYVQELAADAQTRMREYAGLSGATPAERLALATAALGAAFDPRSHLDDALPLATAALADGLLVAEQTADSPPFGNACYVLVFAEDLDAAEAELERALADARTRGSTFAFMTVSLGWLMIGLLRGSLSPAIAHGEAALSTWPELPRTLVVQRWFSAVIRLMVEALLARGELEPARSLVQEWAPRGDLESIEFSLVRYARGLLARADGHRAAALADFLAFGEICAAAGYEDRTTPWRLEAALTASHLGDREQALALADEALVVARTWGAPGGLGAAQRVRALVGEAGLAAAGLAESVATLTGSSFALTLAEARVDHGVSLRRAGQRSAARAELEAGLEGATRCEASLLAERARAELLVLGARPRRLMFSGVEALTATERRVAGMAAEGLSNREIAQSLFVTKKTVETHLRSVYRKLSIASRNELPAQLAAAV